MARAPTRRAVPSSEPAKLTKPREELRAHLSSRIQIGEQLAETPIQSAGSLGVIEGDFDRWSDYNYELLLRGFSDETYANSYRGAYISFGMNLYQGPTFSESVERQKAQINCKVQHLKSLVERLDLIDEAPGITTPVAAAAAPRQVAQIANSNVFLVHGHDESAKQIVARFIERCDLNPIILHEQANNGRTIIEKFEAQADVGFAIVVLTSDDIGAAKPSDPAAQPELQDRARQNVVLELGYFLGRLGRERVAALKKGALELPSDFLGVVWTDMDHTDAWKIGIARELKAAGFDVDLNKALG